MNGIISKFFDRAFNKKWMRVSPVDTVKPIEGIFDLQLIEKDGTVSKHIHEKNLIVDSSFDILSSLLVYASSGKLIDTIALGNKGIVDNQYIYPFVTDKTLRSESFRKVGVDTITIESITEKSITFQFSLDYAEGNGIGASIYNEAGLFSNDGTLFSRKVFSEIVKTQEQVIIIRWQLKFIEK